jgi:hypothetical protein
VKASQIEFADWQGLCVGDKLPPTNNQKKLGSAACVPPIINRRSSSLVTTNILYRGMPGAVNEFRIYKLVRPPPPTKALTYPRSDGASWVSVYQLTREVSLRGDYCSPEGADRVCKKGARWGTDAIYGHSPIADKCALSYSDL